MTVVVPDEMLERWKSSAFDSRMSLSAWVRARLNEAAGLTEVDGEWGIVRDSLVTPRELVDAEKLSPPPTNARGARKTMCEHRVPAGSYCKVCDG